MTDRLPDYRSRCSIDRTLEVVGDRWSVLLVRNAFRGRSRFAEFRDSLGIASDVLTARLRTLVDAGIFERRPYRDAGARERFSYHLTPAGIDLLPVLGALQQWGDDHRPSPDGPPATFRSALDGAPVRVAFVDGDDRVLPVSDVVNVPRDGVPASVGFARQQPAPAAQG
jgi:DNA-binding HxlR family transcriptional regulator